MSQRAPGFKYHIRHPIARDALRARPPEDTPQNPTSTMSRRGDAATQQRNQQTLKSLLKLEPNKICADCKIHKRT